MNTELRLDHNISSSNKHGKNAKDNRITDLSENNNMPGNNIRKPCLEQANNMLQEQIIANQGTE